MIKPRPACGRTGLLVSLEAQIWFVQENNVLLKIFEIQCTKFALIMTVNYHNPLFFGVATTDSIAHCSVERTK